MQLKSTFVKLLAILIMIGFCLSYVQPIKATQTNTLLISGDANCDGEVNTSDAVYILRNCTSLVAMDLYSTIAGDLNGDGIVNTSDATTLLRTIISDDDLLKPLEILGDINAPVFYTDIFYRPITTASTEHIILSKYTSDAVETPKSTIAFGQGYSFELSSGYDYIFETRPKDANHVDTVIYLMDSTNNIFLSDDNSGDGKYSRIQFHAWEGGTYKLLVTGKSSNEVGTCELEFGKHTSVAPPPANTPRPTSTPTNTPKPSPSPTATQPPTGGITFANQSLPTGGATIQYKSPYQLKGVINADKPIINVRAEILDNNGKQEQSASRNIAANLGLTTYALTDGGATSIDGQMLFSQLSIGTKTFKLYCTTKGQSEKLIFTAKFYMGATDSVLVGNAFAGSASLSFEVRETILDYINSLDEKRIETQVIMEALTKLGITYGTGTGQFDCSSYVQWACGQAGISLPRTAAEQGRYCDVNNVLVSSSNVRSGDLVFFRSTTCHCGSRYHEIHHVTLFLGPIDGVKYYLEASSGKKKTVLRRAWGDDTSGWTIEFYGRPY